MAAMDNKTVKDAFTTHGTDPQFLIEKILRTRIYESTYWKEKCFALTESTLIERAYDLTAIGGQYGNQKPTEFICLVLKMLQLQPRQDIIQKYITGLSDSDSNKYLRALGIFYLRLTGKPLEIYTFLEPLLADSRKLRKLSAAGYSIIHMDEFVDQLLREERVCDVVLPRLVKRHVLEDNDDLDPRISPLETLGLLQDEEDEEKEEGENEEKDMEVDEEGKSERQRRRSRSRSDSRDRGRSRSPATRRRYRSSSRSRSRSLSSDDRRRRKQSHSRDRRDDRDRSRRTSSRRSRSRSFSASRSPSPRRRSYSPRDRRDGGRNRSSRRSRSPSRDYRRRSRDRSRSRSSSPRDRRRSRNRE